MYNITSLVKSFWKFSSSYIYIYRFFLWENRLIVDSRGNFKQHFSSQENLHYEDFVNELLIKQKTLTNRGEMELIIEMNNLKLWYERTNIKHF